MAYISTITPGNGPIEGGTPVTITGTGFEPSTTAAIDYYDLTDLVVVDETTITGITPPGTEGAKDVTISTIVGQPWINTGYPGIEGEIAGSFFHAAMSADGTVIIASSIETDSDNGYVWVSTNSGQSWTKIVELGNRQWSGFALSSSGVKQVAIVDGGSIWTSVDTGSTWTEQTSAGTKSWQSVCCSDDGSIIYATELNEFCYKSVDSGVTWAVTESTASFLRNVACSSNGSVVVTGSGPVVYLSSDGGDSWNITLDASSNTYWPFALGVDSNGTNILASTIAGEIFVSNDSGNNWVNVINTPYGCGDNVFVSSDGSTMIVNPGFAFFSYDYGASWSSDTNGSPYFITANKTDGTLLLGSDNNVQNWWTYEGILPSATITTETLTGGFTYYNTIIKRPQFFLVM